MTYEDAIAKLQEIYSKLYYDEEREAIKMAIEALEEKINREESPCFDCSKDNCKNCLYNGQLE